MLPGGTQNTTSPPNATNSTGTTGGNNNTNTTIGTNPTTGNNSTTNSTTNTTNPVGNTTAPDGYTILSLEQVAQNSQIQGSLTYGVNSLVQLVVNQNKAPNTTYSINSISDPRYKNQNNGVSYRFTIGLINAKYAHIDANISVFRYNNQSYRLNAYSFRSYNYTIRDLPGSNTGGSASNTTVTNSTGGSNNPNTTVGNLTNSTVGITPVNNTGSPVTNQTSPDGYTYLDVNKVLLNNTLVGYLNFGTAYVLQRGVNQTKIPDTPFTLTSVTLFAEKAVPAGMNYNVTASLKNANNVTVGMNFTERYNARSQALSVISYSYNVNFPRRSN